MTKAKAPKLVVPGWQKEIEALRADNEGLREEIEWVRGELAVAIDIFHAAGPTLGIRPEWEDDVAGLLARHWPVSKPFKSTARSEEEGDAERV